MDENKSEKKLVLKQFLVYIISDNTKQISDVITEMRALPGVVTISVFEATRKMSQTKNLTKLKLKYLQFSNNLKESIKILKKSILKVDGVSNAILKMKKSDLINNSNSSPNNTSQPKSNQEKHDAT